jgi:hypothetical protein
MTKTPRRTMKQILEIPGDKAATYESWASFHLANANEAAEKGKQEKAEKLYEKAQHWLDKANKARGWA